MYKKKISNIARLIFVVSAIFLFGSVFWYDRNIVSGIGFFSPDVWMQQETDQAYTRSSRKIHKNFFDGGDIFSNTYQQIRDNGVKSVGMGVQQAQKAINKRFSCDLSVDDISTIVYRNPTTNAYTERLAKIDKNEQTSSNQLLVNSCKKLFLCLQEGVAQVSNFDENKENMTASDLTVCQNTVINSYKYIEASQIDAASLEQYSYGDDMFANGDLSDSSYDLLVDVKNISDLMFASNKKPESVVLFKFPEVKRQFEGAPVIGRGTIPGVNDGTTGKLYEFIPWKGYPPLKTNLLSTTISSGSNGSGLISGDFIPNNTDVSVDEILKEKNQTENNLPFENAFCEIDGAPVASIDSYESQKAALEDQQNQIYDNISAQNTNSVVKDSLSGSDRSSDVSIYAGKEGVERLEDLVNGIDDFLEGPDNGDLVGPGGDVKQCYQTCNTNFPTKNYDGYVNNLVCKARCSCDITSAADGLIQLRYCFVPGTAQPITPGKNVVSIEEVVNHFSSIIKALKNSGELMKSKKTKEFLETSMQKIKLNEIVRFNISVGFKPIFNVKPTKTVQQKEQNQQKNIEKNTMGNYGDQNLEKEKNKYLVLFNPNIYEKQKEIGVEVSTIINSENQIEDLSSKKDAEYLTNILQLSTQNKINQEFQSFLEYNIDFLLSIKGFVEELDSLSKTLEGKIVK